MNCQEVVLGRAGTGGRGRDTAWFVHCRTCAELAQEQLEPLDLLPADSGLVIYRCRRCGDRRVCRAGWRTRCHVCLDGRSAGSALDAGAALLARMPQEADLAAGVRQFAGLAADAPVPVRTAAEFSAAVALGEDLDRYARDGWSVVAGDVHGLPWFGRRLQPTSHGTWAIHDTCGTLQKATTAQAVCRSCQPEPGSRSFLLLQDTPYLLYLVRHRGLQKFGVGGERRVRTHLGAGATVLQVLEARHADVITAEAILKRQKQMEAVPLRFWRTRRMPASFGVGTEVVRASVPINLSVVLPNGVDVTHRFTREPV
ncbi:hypothetical protein [Micromonospora auratinigra]|uniref:hypothetical protein n=1 Tax=Micromonospora auratinigra TaxID=261654 RepID=UPI0012FE63DF|nr:hypothetical protein [Micromonospora auratinigra]